MAQNRSLKIEFVKIITILKIYKNFSRLIQLPVKNQIILDSKVHTSETSNLSTESSSNRCFQNRNYLPKKPHSLCCQRSAPQNYSSLQLNFRKQAQFLSNNRNQTTKIEYLNSYEINSNNQILIETVYEECPFHSNRTEWYIPNFLKFSRLILNF